MEFRQPRLTVGHDFSGEWTFDIGVGGTGGGGTGLRNSEIRGLQNRYCFSHHSLCLVEASNIV